MQKDIRWKIPLIVIVIAIAIFAIYPPFDKTIRKERIKEIDGKVVSRETIDKNWTDFFVTNPIISETILNETTDSSGSKVVEKTAEYKARGQVKLGLDLKGGSELLYKVRVNKKEDRSGLTKEIIEVLKKRIDPKGILEYRIQEQGSHRILIQVPGAAKLEIEALKDRLTRLGILEFKLAASKDSSEYLSAAKGEDVPGYYKHWIRKVKGEKGETDDWYLVRNKSEITGEHLASVYPERKDVQAVVGFEFDQVGIAKFGKLTERNIGKPLAIILDGVLYSAPMIRDRIPGKGIIEGGFSQEEVNDLIAVMRAGSLPADLELEMETTVGPSLGKDSITNVLNAGLIASIFVVLFMGIFYLGIGWVANFALALNILLILGTLVIIKATITLPGLAGLVLTIGMAVDANVLIFERIREEKNVGKTIKLALKNGYDRAFTTIFDSNLTTIITAVILAAVGTGPVKGFAWVLIVGLLINMFTAILVTRVIYNIFLAKNWIHGFHMLNFFTRTSFSFIRFRRVAIPASIVLIVIGLTIFIIRGSNNYDIDFTGGTLAHLQLKNPASVDQVRTSLTKHGYPNAEVQGLWSSGAVLDVTGNSTDFGIRIKGLSENKVKEKFKRDIEEALSEKKVICNLAFTKPTEFNISTDNEIEDDVIQTSLTVSGYGLDDIISVEPTDVKSKTFDIIVVSSDVKEDLNSMLKELINRLQNNLLTYQVNLSFGNVNDESASTSSNTDNVTGSMNQASMDLDLSEQMDLTLLQMELNRAGFTDITVNKRESSRVALTTRLEIKGSKSLLNEMKNKMNKTLTASSLAFINDSTIRIDLKEPVFESELRSILNGIPIFEDSLKKVVTTKVKSSSFLVKMNPLSTEKIQGKIQDDIVEIFRDNLHSENIKIAFSQENIENSNEENSENTVLRVELNSPVQKKKIEKILTDTGYLDLLEQSLEDGKSYNDITLKAGQSEIETMKDNITNAFVIPMPLKRIVSIGAAVANEMKGRAILALIFACFAIIVYVWYRFGEFKYGAAAVIALIHDVLITLGAVAVADHFGNIFGEIKLNLPMVAAFLTLVGYSLNDTIVVFDRIRENAGGGKKTLDINIIDKSINQTLNRTLLTSSTTLGVLVALYFVGGSEIHGFAFVMMVGVIVGTYSSIFIASPILIQRKK